MRSHKLRRIVSGGIAAWLLLVTGQIDLPAQDEELVKAPATKATTAPALITGAFRDTEYGDVPHFAPDRPSRGYPHYDLPSQRYGQWYRPQVFGLGQSERCLPRPFRPRGHGNLLTRPSTCYRMDYHPFAVEGDATTKFGPSYYLRQPDGRCLGDALISHDEETRWFRFNVHQQLKRVAGSAWTLLKIR